MKVYIKPNTAYSHIVRYVLKTIEKNQQVHFTWVSAAQEAQLIWEDENPQSQPLHVDFYTALSHPKNTLTHQQVFTHSPVITAPDGAKDVVATIFYMMNCIQERNPDATSLDSFGRFKYESSFQHKFGLMEKNRVQQEIDAFCTQHSIKGKAQPSTFFISHDIDNIYGSFTQDGLWAVKKMKIGVILNLIAWEITRKPHWRNIDKIIQMNSEYDIRSTFFWLVNKGAGKQGIKNADYDIRKEKDLLALVTSSHFVNGLHKSCSDMTIDQEIEKGQLNTTFNRYHFLNFLPHSDWDKISESKLNFDCSLGFAEHYGFRNSYGKAFQPFDVKNNKPYTFVEAPLHFMDTTFHKYMKIPVNQIGDRIIDFYEKNPVNCDFSLLWHNSYFTRYKYQGFVNEYKKVLTYMYDKKIACVNPQQLINQTQLQW